MENSRFKFRAWDSETEEMYYTGESFDIIFYFDSEGIVAERVTEDETEKLEHLEYMAYTGLKDKKFKEIYEGDIVKYKDYGEEHISKVIQDFRLGTGHYIKSPGIGFYSINERTIKALEIEVIGNVFEDSHLLEEQHG